MLVLALSAAGVLATVSLTNRATASAETAAPAARPALTVTTTRASSSTVPVSLSANGSIAAWQDAIIGSESNGLRLAEVRVNVGDVVKKGQLLARFADDAVRADIDQANAALLEAKANADEAAANAARARALDNSGAFSAQQVSQYLTAERTASARVKSAQASLNQQQLRLKYTQVVAPDDGVISARNATVGAVVGAGTELFRMIRQGRLEWRAEVTAPELARIKVGAAVKVQAASGLEVNGKVRALAPTVDQQSRISLVYVDLDQKLAPAVALKAGMFAKGRFELGSNQALMLPQQAIVVRDGFNYVFRVNPDNRVRQVKVTTGRRQGDLVEVTSGLSADVAVVVSGTGFLNDGDLVRNVTAPVASKTAAPAKR